MELGSLEEIERWVLSWGDHATVLEPTELKRRIRRAGETILSKS
jgi:predicted DNA-binding transcriptional regulator YafY